MQYLILVFFPHLKLNDDFILHNREIETVTGLKQITIIRYT